MRLRDVLTAARRAVRAARLEAYRYLRDRREARQDAARAPAPARVPAAEVRAEVLVYFADPPANLYQLRQWLPILTQLHERHPVGIVCRSAATVEAAERETDLPVVLVRSLRDLGGCYDGSGAKVCLYVNNHHLNFLSLTFPDQLHVHLNHGESDKISMASNQAKAYDRVLVAGEVAVERYRANLLGFDAATLVVVGRPQLDLLPPSRVPPDGNRTVLYAPTWEGGRDEMDYSSLATMGEAIVAALDDAGWRVVYRPHPKVGADDAAADTANRRIVARLEQRAAAGAGHRISPPDEPIGEAFADAEVLVADVSSVLLDFLVTGRPAVVTRPPGSPGRLVDPGGHGAGVAYPLGVDDVPRLGEMLERIRTEEPRRDERAALVERFFGDTTPGASTRRFLDAVGGIVADRDRLVADRRTRRDARAEPSETP